MDADILINVLEGCIILLIWAVGLLFNFYHKQEERFSPEALLRMSHSSPSMEKFGVNI